MYATVEDLPWGLYGQGVAAINEKVASNLDCSPGDPVSVTTPDAQQRVLKVYSASSDGKPLVLLDEHERKALQISEGAKVSVERVSWSPAESITIVPPSTLPDSSQAFAEIRSLLLGRPVHSQQWVAVKSEYTEPTISDVWVIQTATIGSDCSSGVVEVTEETNIEFVVPRNGSNERYSSDLSEFEIVHEINPDARQTPRANTEDSESYGYNEFRVPGDAIADVTYDDIGGLDDVVRQFREVSELPFEFPELKRYLGIQGSAGLLLAGPPGTGKTLMAKALANETDAAFYRVDGPEVLAERYGKTERRIRELFEAARASAPSIVYFDEFDSLGQTRGRDSTMRRVVGQLLSELDGLDENDDVVAVASTNDDGAVDQALRRPGRFGTTIEVGVPSVTGRTEIFEIHTAQVPLASEVDLTEIAAKTHGYTGADIESVVRKAQKNAFNRHLVDANLCVERLLDVNWSDRERKLLLEEFEEYAIKTGDFDAALEDVGPTGLVDYRVTVPETTWDDVGGLEDVKSTLREVVVTPIEHPDAFEAMDITPRAGVLLAGPPGTGKTMLARAVATETEANFMHVNGPELMNKWVGESEANVREVFSIARETGPTVLFFDEIDSLIPERGIDSNTVTDRVTGQFLAELDGLVDDNRVIVIGTTNRPDCIDDAMLREQRLGNPLTVDLPDERARTQILASHTREKPLADDVDLEVIANQTSGESGSTLASICNRAATIALREAIDYETIAADSEVPTRVRMRHFEEAMSEMNVRFDSSNRLGNSASAD